jgi:hypothetical protein
MMPADTLGLSPVTARCAEFLLAKPGYKMGKGPLSESQ